MSAALAIDAGLGTLGPEGIDKDSTSPCEEAAVGTDVEPTAAFGGSTDVEPTAALGATPLCTAAARRSRSR